VNKATSCLLKPVLYMKLFVYSRNLSPCLVQNRQRRLSSKVGWRVWSSDVSVYSYV